MMPPPSGLQLRELVLGGSTPAGQIARAQVTTMQAVATNRHEVSNF
jgi:hypothetical protein